MIPATIRLLYYELLDIWPADEGEENLMLSIAAKYGFCAGISKEHSVDILITDLKEKAKGEYWRRKK